MSLRLSDNLTLSAEAARRVFAFLAIRGAGKTWAAAVLAEEMVKAGVPIIVLDPMGVWWGLRVGYDGRGKGLPVVVFGGDHADLPLELEKAEKLADALIQSNVSCVVDISELTQGQTQRFIPRFLDELRRKNANDRHVFIEEADVIAPQKPMRDETVCLHAVDIFVRRGGNRNLGCTLISQRSAVVNKNVLTQSDFMVAMRTNAPQDKEAVAAWAVRRTRDKSALNEWLDSLSDLKDGEAYVWGPDMNVPGVKTRFRMRETFHATRENLKRFDASKIRPMDVDEFIDRFRDVFEGRRKSTPPSIPKSTPPVVPTPIPAVIPHSPPGPGAERTAALNHPSTAPPLQDLDTQEDILGRLEQIDLEHKQLVVRVQHSERVIPMDTDSQRGQVVYVLIEGRDLTLSITQIVERAAEHGWVLPKGTLQKSLVPSMMEDGLLINEVKGHHEGRYRLPSFVRFEVKVEVSA